MLDVVVVDIKTTQLTRAKETHSFRQNHSYLVHFEVSYHQLHSKLYTGQIKAVRIPITSLPHCNFVSSFPPSGFPPSSSPSPLSLLIFLCLPLSFLCELDSWDAVSVDRWSSRGDRLTRMPSCCHVKRGRKNPQSSQLSLWRFFVRSLISSRDADSKIREFPWGKGYAKKTENALNCLHQFWWHC